MQFSAQITNINSADLTSAAFIWSVTGHPDTAANNVTLPFSQEGPCPCTLQVSDATPPITILLTSTVSSPYMPVTIPPSVLHLTSWHPMHFMLREWFSTPSMDTSIPAPLIELANDTILTVMAEDANGCNASDTVKLTHYSLPETGIDNHIFCHNESPVISTPHYPEYDITWKDAAGNIFSTEQKVTIPEPSSYIIQLANTKNPACIRSDTFEVWIATAP